MFVKKLVDFATKKPGGSSNSLRTDDINPRLVFHYGIPAGSSSLAYDSIQKILAICTKDGRIKLYAKDNTQALLESDEAVPSKFLQFMENQGILLNVNVQNHIEVWDIERKQLCHVHAFKGKITSFMVIQRSSFAYIGDSLGNVSVLNLERELSHLICMQYNIPFTASHGNTTEVAEATAVMFTLPQPLSERRRVLIIYRDGLIILWGIQESKPVFATGGNTLNLLVSEAKQVTSACWACPYGSKVIIGYSNGEILLWSVPIISNQKNIPTTDKEVFCAAQNVPILKLNLGYKMEKIPIVSLRWVSGDARASRLYVNGVSEDGSSSSFQVNLLQENSESRMIKLVLPLSKPCLDMEIISCMSNHNNDKQDLLLLLESGHLCAFDDSEIEKYLLQSQQSKGSPQLQNNIKVKVPFIDSSITQAIFITNNSDLPNYIVEDHMPVKTFPSLFATNAKGKGGNYPSSTHFSGFTKIKNLYITGHANGAINFWDVSCPFFILVLAVVQQSEDDPSLSGVPVTSLYFDIISRVLVSGDQQGMVRIFNFKEQANMKQGCSHIIHSMKLVKVIGAVLSIQANPVSGRLAVGSDEGCVSIIDKERATILWQKRFSAEIYTGVMALQFVDCILNASQKCILLVALKDSSVLGLEGDTGNPLSSCGVRSKKPSRALLMQILDGQDTSVHGSNITSSIESNEGNGVKESTSKQSIVLVCSEKAARVYSFMHLVQGIKKVHNKKKFHGTCCWASTFVSLSSDIGLILLFTSGKIEIRSLPDLSLLKETWIRGFTFSSSAPSSNSSQSISCSSEGELILVNGDQEIFLFSILFRNDIYRHVDSMTQVYSEAVPAQDRHTSVSLAHKEKKKGFFSSVMKDIKGNKTKQSQDTEVVDSEESNEELAVLFSAPNFPLNVEDQDGLSSDENDVKLNIDDIDLEDEGGKPKARSNLILNKHKLAGKLQAIKGKLIAAKVKNTETSVKEEPKEDKNATSLVDIKKRYGYPMASDPSTSKLAESKLNENLKKLQGINTRATAMENTAQSFSSTAKELLRIVQQEKRTT